MKNPLGKRFVFVALLVLGVISIGVYLGRNIIMRKYDAARLAKFSQQVAGADRILGSWKGSSVQLTIAGDDVKKIVRAVSSAASARDPKAEYMCMYDARATFYSGTNALGDIDLCNGLFLLGSEGPPFFEVTGVLDTALYTPLLNRLRESPLKSSR